MQLWIDNEFIRTSRAKCLVLIGPTGTGKTSFARSLPGRVNYFQSRWSLDEWSDYARYSVYDDVPWDKFEQHNFPSKKGLLTQNGPLPVTDKYRKTLTINVQQHAIVLMNPEDAGSLNAEPKNEQQKQAADYWKERLYIYRMGKSNHSITTIPCLHSSLHRFLFKQDTNEYFVKPKAKISLPNNPTSAIVPFDQNEQRFGDPDEFERMNRQFEQQQQ